MKSKFKFIVNSAEGVGCVISPIGKKRKPRGYHITHQRLGRKATIRRDDGVWLISYRLILVAARSKTEAAMAALYFIAP